MHVQVRRCMQKQPACPLRADPTSKRRGDITAAKPMVRRRTKSHTLNTVLPPAGAAAWESSSFWSS